MVEQLVVYSDEVQRAKAEGLPIVALESTIISHGMPYPENCNTAQEVEQIIRDYGVTPATIALYQGKIHIGLNKSIIKHLAGSDHILKASRRDIAYVLTRKHTASTTVAATMYCAYLAKIPFFVTGGIGGVHREAEVSFDISADLTELSSTPVMVICSGAKSILDLPKTLEVLETQGVAVVGYRTDEFPAFYSRSSGIRLSQRLDDVAEIASLMHHHQLLKLKNGIVIANPIPIEREMTDEELAPFIQQAHHEARDVTGQSVTPYLLKRIGELTAGRSLQANIELIKNNAHLGAQIALAYAAKSNSEILF